MIPVYKLEFYTGAVLDHTITSNALSIFTKEAVTDQIGTFTIMLPLRKGTTTVYDDIALFDKVKVYYGYDSVGATPDFIGRVEKIVSPVETEKGFMRQISGHSQGEILRRRIKTNDFYLSMDAHDIVDDEIAADLSLGDGDIAADTTEENIEIRHKTYFDLLREVSDYYTVAAQVKKDFFVDVDNDLVWKARPIRTAGVESFTLGTNILKYQVTRFLEYVKNNINVYGAAESYLPSDKDSWTESLTNWTASDGDLALEAVTIKAGAKSIKCTQDATPTGFLIFKRTFDRVTIRDINTIQFWHTCSEASLTRVIRLLAPDTTNYFSADLTLGGGNWYWEQFAMGPDQIYDADENATGPWTETGSPNWWDIEGIQFYRDGAVTDGDTTIIDGLWFYPDRWSGSASNGASQTSYGQRDLEVTDDSLHSDTECARRAETLLYQLKDPTVQIELLTYGNGNVLVGDRIAMTLADENISAANFDVISVEHSFINGGWTTKATMTDSENRRQPLKSPMRSLYRGVKELNVGLENIR